MAAIVAVLVFATSMTITSEVASASGDPVSFAGGGGGGGGGSATADPAPTPPPTQAEPPYGIPPDNRYKPLGFTHEWVTKPGPVDCGHVEYLQLDWPQPPSLGLVRKAFKDGQLIQTREIIPSSLRDSLTASSGVTIEAPPGKKLHFMTGTGVACTPEIHEYIANRKIEAYQTTYEVWYIPRANVPVVDFEHKGARDGARTVTFTDRSTDVEDGTDLTYLWNFGDGTTSTQKNPIHTYPADGEYLVTLTAKDREGNPGSKGYRIEVGPPLDGALFPWPSGDFVMKEEDRLPTRLRVENAGELPLADVAVTSITTTATDEEGTGELTITPKVGGEALSGVLGTGGDRLDFADYDIVAKQAGKVRVDVAVEADLPDGKPTTAVITAEVEIRPAPIKVELEVAYAEPPGGAEEPPGFDKDNNGDGKVDAKDHRIEIEVTATNRGDEEVAAVEVNDAAEPIDFDDKYLGGGEVYLDPIEGPWQTKFGDLDVGESQSITYVYEAMEPVWADATTIVKGRNGDAAGPLVTGVGRTVVKLDTDLSLEAYMDLEERPYAAGQVVRLNGKIKNIEEDKVLPDGSVDKAKSLAVILDPIVEENASNGYVMPADYGGRTPQGNSPFVLLPGQEMDVKAIVPTARKDLRSEAHIRYLVRAWEIDDEKPDELAQEIDQSRIVIDDDEGHGTEFSTVLSPVDLRPDKLQQCESDVKLELASCNLLYGFWEFGTGLAQLVPVIISGTAEYVRAGIGIRAWMAQQWKDVVLAILQDPKAMARLQTEIEVQMETYVQAKIMSQEALDSVGASVVQFFQEAEQVLVTGDANQIVAWASRFLGENPDLGMAAITKVRAARALFGVALPSASQSEATVALAKAAEDAAAADKLALESKIDEAIAKGENPATNGTFKGDEDITNIPRVFRGIYGARKTEINKMLELAKSENILIAFRQRSPRAADLIKKGLARLKGMDVKTKGVSEIDINYFGYRREAKDLVELVEPPIDWRLAKKGREAEFKVAVDEHMEKLKAKHPEIGADPVWEAEVRDRLETRTKEWIKEVPNFRRYKAQGIEMNFGYAEQGLPDFLDDVMAEPRKARVTTGTIIDPITGKERLYMTLEMADENGLNFLPITGDIDIVAILNADRSPLTDVVKRTRIYQELSKLVGMQHGDSFSWINGEGQIKFLREHLAGKQGAEALVVAGSDGRARMGYFEERLSTVTDAAGNEVSKTTFHMVTGAPRELVTDAAGGVPLKLPNRLDTLEGWVDDPRFYAPGSLEKFMKGVPDDGSEPALDPTAPAIKPDGEGGALQYTEGGIEGDAGWTGTASASGDLADAADPVEAAAAEVADAGFGPAAAPDQGAQGGRWVPYDAAAGAAASPTGRFPRGVITAIDGEIAAGTTVLPVLGKDTLGVAAGSPWFQVGDTIVVDPGGAHEERHVVAKVSPLTTKAPLAHGHLHATSVLLVPREVEEPTEPTTPTTPTVPTTPTEPLTPTEPTSPTAPTVPATAAPGAASGGEVTAAATGTLPRTGSSVTDLLPLALALVLAGAGILGARSRTRRRSTV